MAKIIGRLPEEERKKRILAIDSDLEGSTGLIKIRQKYPECYISSGIMERGNFSAAAGFGRDPNNVAIFSTFCAFLEMCISEIFMARLNSSNVLCYFTHSGVDDMADNTCHYGLNLFFADNGLAGQAPTPLYFPADATQAKALLARVFQDPGLRCV